jgi:endonuclease-3 related protein
MPASPAIARRAFRRLLARLGPQGWWPGEGPVETMVGAVLVQNTAWRNAERAVHALRDAGWLDWERLAGASLPALAARVRSAGTYRVKARRLRALARFVVDAGGLGPLSCRPTPALRAALLGVEGVGEETADVILVYAFSRPVVVLDAYTRRITARLGWFPDPGRRHDQERRVLLEGALGDDAGDHGECHALLVELGKTHCHKREPRCSGCPLRSACAHGGGVAPAGAGSAPATRRALTPSRGRGGSR